MSKLYIDEFVGISNRFEALPLAFAIQKKYGHEILIDWRELDSFEVEGTRPAKLYPWRKLGAVRLRDCTEDEFNAIGHRNVICRSLDGPDHVLKDVYMEVPKRLRLKKSLTEAIQNTFASYADRPVVAVHVRRGDYFLESEEVYSTKAEWPAVPVWCYAKAMEKVREIVPNVAFFIAHNGPREDLASLFSEFDCFTLTEASPYGYKSDDHQSIVNPVADLFALACAKTLIATPLSGYSHWAANVMGPKTISITPVSGATKSNPKFGWSQMYGERLPVWRDSGRTGNGVRPLEDSWINVPFDWTTDTQWIRSM